MNHDDHYATRRDDFETIKTQLRMMVHRIPEEFHEVVIRNFQVATAFKYMDRLGEKDDFNKELDKAINYLTRARTGDWVKAKPSSDLRVSEDQMTADFGGVALRAVDYDACTGCELNTLCVNSTDKVCDSIDRKDGRDIKWVKSYEVELNLARKTIDLSMPEYISPDQTHRVVNGLEYFAKFVNARECEGCAFYTVGCSIAGTVKRRCSPIERKDGKNIIWVKRDND